MLNLDTHILVYALSGELTKRETDLLSAQPWSIAAIVLWEMTTLSRLGRISIDVDSTEFAHALGAIQIWPLDLAVCRALKKLDFQSDPADMLIAATSLLHNVPLVTRDRAIRRSKVVPLAKI